MFAHTIRVRWAEVDAQGVVFNPNYLVYTDVAVTEFMRAAGCLSNQIPDVEESYVVDAHIVFKAPARFDDLLTLEVSAPRVGRSSYECVVRILRDGALLAGVTMKYVRASQGKAIPLSEQFRALIGQEMHSVE